MDAYELSKIEDACGKLYVTATDPNERQKVTNDLMPVSSKIVQ